MKCLLLLLAVSPLVLQAQSPANLRCEWQLEPLAIQTAAPRFSWNIVASSDTQRGLRQTAYRIIVASSDPLIRKHVSDLWDSARIESSNTLQIPYAGKSLNSSMPYYWAVQSWDQAGIPHWSSPAKFQTGLLHQIDWSATWITAALSPETEAALPLLRREFNLSKPVAHAMLYIAGLGQYELYLNGNRLGDAIMSPAWTDYRKTIVYNSFDITSALRKGDNVLGVALGNGMYNVERTKGRYTKFQASFGPLKLLLQTQITFTDKTTLRLVSDHEWRTIQGPTTYSSIYGGEDYDARRDQSGWMQPGFNEKDWLEAQETESPGGLLLSQQSPPVRVFQTFHPIKVTEPAPGISVYDLGQNFAGWPALSVKGPRGASLKLTPGELLDRDGFASQRSTGGPQWFTYTLKGHGTETWHPHFSYWGFRYVQVERQPDAGVLPELLSLDGQSIHAAATPAGEFDSSSTLLNRIHQLIDNAVSSNLQSILTDCPHREKLGWLEQSHLLASALFFNFDLATLYEKIANDISDAQQPDGLVPDIAPEYTVFAEGFRDSPEWGSALILDPWLTYQTYGDSAILATHYEAMQRYAAYLASKTSDNLLTYGLGDWYDLGPGEPGLSKLTTLGFTATAVYYQDLLCLSKIARVLHNSSDESLYRTEAARVRQSFNSHFYNSETHNYDRSSQTNYAMALATGLAPDADRAFILEKLIAAIRVHQNHVTAGDIGFHYVVQALMDNGRSDVLYDMLSRTDPPSYGYQLEQGATTLTEDWNANPLHSQNHFMLGHAEEWFYRGLAGIDLDLSRPESERLLIRPAPVGDLTLAAATYRSVLGTITTRWTRRNGALTLTVDVPPNLSALIQFPAAHASPDNPNAVTLQPAANNLATFRVLSGHYVFKSY